MNIHIRGPVEFEKILVEPYQPAIETTRIRMSVQQLLDTQESPEHLRKQLKNYIHRIDRLMGHLSKRHTQPIVEHPLFQWSLNDSILVTPCWKIETILPRFALAIEIEKQCHELVSEEKFKTAHNLFKNKEKLHIECMSKLLSWKWKLSSLNHDILQSNWHLAQADLCRGMADLCMLCTGIQKQTGSKAMFIVSQRALRHFARSLATWPSEQGNDLMNIAEALRYYYSSDILWSQGKYGQSIYRLERWQTSALEFGPFELLKTELEKIPFLAKERRHTNDGAYFDPISAASTLVEPNELIHMSESTDIPHPSTSPALDDVDEDASTPAESSEI